MNLDEWVTCQSASRPNYRPTLAWVASYLVKGQTVHYVYRHSF